jgi:hypothetical protein
MWCIAEGHDVWHPIPTIIDHDTTIASTYANDDHAHRRPTVTWREFGRDEITRVDFWTPPASPPFITNPHLRRCWLCEQEPAAFGTSRAVGAMIGLNCAKAIAASLPESAR